MTHTDDDDDGEDDARGPAAGLLQLIRAMVSTQARGRDCDDDLNADSTRESGSRAAGEAMDPRSTERTHHRP